jgi:hypothetical protein
MADIQENRSTIVDIYQAKAFLFSLGVVALFGGIGLAIVMFKLFPLGAQVEHNKELIEKNTDSIESMKPSITQLLTEQEYTHELLIELRTEFRAYTREQ